MGENQKDPLKKINEALEEIRKALNETGDKGKQYLLHIEDNISNEASNRTEDIELKVTELRLSKK